MPDGFMLVRMAMWFGAFRPVVLMPVMLVMHVLVPMAIRFMTVLERDRIGAGPRTGRKDCKQQNGATERQRRCLDANACTQLTGDRISQ